VKKFEEYEKEYKEKYQYNPDLNVSFAEYIYSQWELSENKTKIWFDKSNNSIGFGKTYGEHSYNNRPIESE
jgi:hypothetical protein